MVAHDGRQQLCQLLDIFLVAFRRHVRVVVSQVKGRTGYCDSTHGRVQVLGSTDDRPWQVVFFCGQAGDLSPDGLQPQFTVGRVQAGGLVTACNHQPRCGQPLAFLIFNRPAFAVRPHRAYIETKYPLDSRVIGKGSAGLCRLKPAGTGKPQAAGRYLQAGALRTKLFIHRFQQFDRVLAAFKEFLLTMLLLLVGGQLQQASGVPELSGPAPVIALAETQRGCGQFGLGIVFHAQFHIERALSITGGTGAGLIGPVNQHDGNTPFRKVAGEGGAGNSGTDDRHC